MNKSFIPSLLLALSLNSGIHAESPDRHPQLEPEGRSVGTSGQTPSQNNLFSGAKISASGYFKNDKPELAIDGQANANQYWGCEKLPASLTVDMGTPQMLSSIRIWPYWEDGRVYKYKIEGSKDNRSWKTLVDQSANSISATADGSTFSFNPAEVRYVRTTMLDNSRGKDVGGHIVEIQGFAKPEVSTLNIAAVPTTRRIPKDGAPSSQDTASKTIAETAWRGERVNGQAVLWTDKTMTQVRFHATPLKGPDGSTIPLKASFVRFTLGGGTLLADIIDEDIERMDLPAGTTRSIWLQADIPATAKPGTYKGDLLVRADGITPVKLPIAVNVLPNAINTPDKWKVHLDLWQHPQAVARVHNVKPWSDEHFALMKPLMKRLADAGQKTITCSLIDEAWGGQTFDWWPAMIEWSMKPDGTMVYDYANFDKWVDFMMNDVGIKQQITCYTMIPWSNKLRYMDQATGDYKYADITPGTPEFEKIWGNFLKNFREHTKKKGWINKICIGIDERPDHAVKASFAVIKKFAPEFKVCSAVDKPTQTTEEVYDISAAFGHADSINGDFATKRRDSGKKTTFYVCCNPGKPNTFTSSPPVESEWLGLFAAANNLDGILRWAYNSWGRDPLMNTDFGNWKAGDCFMVYPGNKTSVRFEKMRDGLETFEKIAILRQAAKSSNATPALKQAVSEMDKLLSDLFTIPRGNNVASSEHETDIEQANKAIRKAALLMK